MKSKLSFKKMATGLFFTIIALIVIGSCKKDYQNEDQPSDRETDKLVQWYESRIKISDDNPFSKLKPNWDKIYVKQLGGHNIYEISLANQEQLVVSTNEEKRRLEDVAQNTETRLLIFEEKSSNKILYASYMNVRANDKRNLPDLHYKKVGNFSGTILYYHFSGNLSNGWNYLKGKITEKITAITEQQFNQSQKQLQGDKNTDAMVCTSGFADKYQWQCVGVPGYQNCGFNYVGKEYVTVCAWQEQETIDHIAPDEGGGYIGPIYVDCNGVAGGTATWSNECNTCIGGTTGLTACPVDTAMNSKFVQNQKAMCALNKLMKDGFFKNILNNFIGTNKPIDLTFKLDSIPQTPGFQTDANTIPNPATWNSNNIDITLAENVINNLTSLEVGLALLHEGVHAEIFRKLISIQGPSNLSTTNFPTLFNLYTQYKVNQGYTHEYMANHYVDLMASALGKFDNNKFTIDYYKAIAWSGLKGTTAYNNLSATKKSEITTKEAALLLNRSKTNCDDSL